MNITAKDVGREVYQPHAWAGRPGKIIAFLPDVEPPVIVRFHNGALESFPTNTTGIRFADEPPDEVMIHVSVLGRMFLGSSADERPDLAGTTWRYSKPERVK